MHSACFSATGLQRRDVFGKEDDRLLARRGFPIVGERSYGNLRHEVVSDEGYDGVVYALCYARNTGRELRQVVYNFRDQYARMNMPTVERFADQYQKLKKERHKFDFDDMLDMVIEHDQPLDIDVLFLDEAQDFTRLQWRAIHVLGRNAKRVYIAGDDDQSIYTFLGADEYGFLEHPAHEDKVLRESHRCPIGIGRYAERVIRQIARRREKDVQWQARAGAVTRVGSISVADVLHAYENELSAMFLLRHRASLSRWSRFLEDAGIPHKVRGEALCCSKWAYAVRTYIRLRRGETVPKGEVCNLFEQIGDQGNARTLRQDGELRELDKDHIAYALSTDAPWYRFFHNRKNAQQIQAMRRLLQRAGTLEIIGVQPTIDISTMHGSKGEEADVVFIDPACNRRSYENAIRRVPSEIRLAYVALTRAKQKVMIATPDTQKYLTTFFPRETL